MVVCEFLGIPQENIVGKGHSFLTAYIIQHIDKDKIEELEDKCMSLFLSLKDKLAEVQMPSEASTTPGTEALAASPAQADSALGQVSEQERLKQIKALQLALRQSLLQSQQPGGREKTQTHNRNTTQHHVPTQDPAPLLGVSPWHREFKISGQIGEPG